MARVRTPAVYRSRLIEPLLSKLLECWVSQDSHLSSRSKLSAVTVAPPSRKTSGIPHRVGQLVFDEVGAKAQHFIQNGSRHGPKAMTGHFLFADTHAPQSSQNRIVAHRPISPRIAGTWENMTSLSGDRMQFAQDPHRLAGKAERYAEWRSW